MSAPTCTERVGPIWKSGGEVCACIHPAGHVFEDGNEWHRCTCGASWVDDLQIAEARR